MISTGGSVRKTACENTSSQAVRGSDTVLFTPQARDNYNVRLKADETYEICI